LGSARRWRVAPLKPKEGLRGPPPGSRRRCAVEITRVGRLENAARFPHSPSLDYYDYDLSTS
jgi:hypothetical protein